MRSDLLRFLSSTAIVVLLSAFAFSQDSRVLSAVGDMYVISAKAGGVNYIEGKVSIARNQGKSGLLLKGDNVEISDKVSTGANGKAEILLNPGSFVRLSQNSNLEFVSTELDNLQIKLNSGSAMFEVFADKDFSVAINTPKSNFNLIQSGVYRIDILPDGTEKIEVWKGKAQIGASEKAVVKGGKAAIIVNGEQQIAKFDRDDRDEFETWSRDRARDLAKINSKLERRMMTNSLVNSFNQSGWNFYDSFGVWVYSPQFGTSCFLPFGYGWRSPYGFGLGYNFGNYNLPWYIFQQPNTNTSAPVNTNPAPAANQNIAKPRRETSVPPFARVRVNEVRDPVYNDTFSPAMPSRSAAPSVVFQPAPAPSETGAKTRGN
ncbi:MAG: hypothetical protein JWN60_2010 [Acidobacteria bacterium]|nr:hypothetical protein [Acidobacteriota bacterium]